MVAKQIIDAIPTGNLSGQLLQIKVQLVVTGGNCTGRVCTYGMRLAAAVAKHKLSKAPLVKSLHWNAVKYSVPFLTTIILLDHIWSAYPFIILIQEDSDMSFKLLPCISPKSTLELTLRNWQH